MSLIWLYGGHDIPEDRPERISYEKYARYQRIKYRKGVSYVVHRGVKHNLEEFYFPDNRMSNLSKYGTLTVTDCKVSLNIIVSPSGKQAKVWRTLHNEYEI